MNPSAHLCKVVEGVEFTVRRPGINVRGVILRETLELLFGADATPQSWLGAYQRHADEIDDVAVRSHERSPEQPLVVLREDRFIDAAYPLPGASLA
jgi:hypothetical protein